MEQILSFNWYELQDILLPVLICVVLPISIVALVMSARKRSEELKTQRYIAALENGADPETTPVKKADEKTPLKKSAADQFRSGCTLGLIGLALLIIGLATGITEWATVIPGSILTAVGLAKVLSFFVNKKYKLDE